MFITKNFHKKNKLQNIDAYVNDITYVNLNHNSMME